MADEERGTRAGRAKKDPEFTDVTCIVSILGEGRDPDTDQKIVHLAGEDVKMKTPLAKRLASSNRPRVAIGKEDREAARKGAKHAASIREKREAATASRVDALAGRSKGR